MLRAVRRLGGVGMNPAAEVFDSRVTEWAEWQASPWGRLRYRLVAHTLDRAMSSLGARCCVLDVGGGDGADSVRLAEAGHHVIILDHSEPLLHRAHAAAYAVIDAPTVRSVTFDHEMHRLEPSSVEQMLGTYGREVTHRFGIRCVSDLIADNELKAEPRFSADLERLELELCHREPYWRIARFWQLVARHTRG